MTGELEKKLRARTQFIQTTRPRAYDTYGNRVADLLARRTLQFTRRRNARSTLIQSFHNEGVQDAGVTTEVSTESNTIVPTTTTCWLVEYRDCR